MLLIIVLTITSDKLHWTLHLNWLLFPELCMRSCPLLSWRLAGGLQCFWAEARLFICHFDWSEVDLHGCFLSAPQPNESLWGEGTFCETVVTCHCELPLKHSFIPPHTTFDCLAACLDTIKFWSPNEKRACKTSVLQWVTMRRGAVGCKLGGVRSSFAEEEFWAGNSIKSLRLSFRVIFQLLNLCLRQTSGSFSAEIFK